MAKIKNPITGAMQDILEEYKLRLNDTTSKPLPSVGVETAKANSKISPVAQAWKKAGINLKDLREEITGGPSPEGGGIGEPVPPTEEEVQKRATLQAGKTFLAERADDKAAEARNDALLSRLPETTFLGDRTRIEFMEFMRSKDVPPSTVKQILDFIFKPKSGFLEGKFTPEGRAMGRPFRGPGPETKPQRGQSPFGPPRF